MNKHIDSLESIARRLRNDERGNIGWIALILMTSIVSMGAIVGLSTYRDHVVQQFGDASVALRNLRQSYKYDIQIDANRNGTVTDPEDCILSGSFDDVVDLIDADGQAPACLVLNAGAFNEQP